MSSQKICALVLFVALHLEARRPARQSWSLLVIFSSYRGIPAVFEVKLQSAMRNIAWREHPSVWSGVFKICLLMIFAMSVKAD
jgi:hypothetical protein